MNRSMFRVAATAGRDPIAISLAVHVVAIALIASITFRYPLAAFFGIDKDRTPTERIQYVEVTPRVGDRWCRRRRPERHATQAEAGRDAGADRRADRDSDDAPAGSRRRLRARRRL